MAAPVAAEATELNADDMSLDIVEAPSSALASRLSDCDVPDVFGLPAYVFHSDKTDAGGSLSGADPLNHPVMLCMILTASDLVIDISRYFYTV